MKSLTTSTWYTYGGIFLVVSEVSKHWEAHPKGSRATEKQPSHIIEAIGSYLLLAFAIR